MSHYAKSNSKLGAKTTFHKCGSGSGVLSWKFTHNVISVHPPQGGEAWVVEAMLHAR